MSWRHAGGVWALVLVACGDAAGADGGIPDAPSPRDASGLDVGLDAAGGTRLQVLAFSDFHGRLEADGSGVGGAAHLARLVRELEAETPASLLVSAGDLVGGSGFLSGSFRDEPTVEVMNAIGLDAACDGNHEHDRPFSELLRLFAGGCHPEQGCVPGRPYPGATFPLLGANVVDAATRAPVLEETLVRMVDGVGVGVVGVTLEGTADIVLTRNVEGLTFLDEVETLNALVPRLRAAGAEVLVALVHQGGAATLGCGTPTGPLFDMLPLLDEAHDVVVGGHTHTSFVCRIGERVVVSSGSYGRALVDVDLTVAAGEVVASEARIVPVTQAGEAAADVDEILAYYADRLEDPVVGTISETLSRTRDAVGQSPLGAVVADAFLASDPRAQIGLLNAGGVRADLVFERSGDEAVDGQVRRSELYTALPFSNGLLMVTLTGAELRALLEAQLEDGTGDGSDVIVSAGFSYAYSVTQPPGSRVLRAALAGAPLEDGASYHTVVNSFLVDRFEVLRDAGDPVYLGGDLQAAVAFFAARSPVAPPTGARVEAE